MKKGAFVAFRGHGRGPENGDSQAFPAATLWVAKYTGTSSHVNRTQRPMTVHSCSSCDEVPTVQLRVLWEEHVDNGTLLLVVCLCEALCGPVSPTAAQADRSGSWSAQSQITVTNTGKAYFQTLGKSEG
jgi:hypothetical protein